MPTLHARGSDVPADSNAGRKLSLYRRVRRRLRQLTPLWILDRYRRARYGRTWLDRIERSAQEVFSQIYREGTWGRGAGEFYSGPGSEGAMIEPYVAAVRRFVQAQRITSIVDIGCGDFRVGTRLVASGISYHGVDIVPAVIAENRRCYEAPGVTFSCLDAMSEEPPVGDLCLIREVFQHLSNRQVSAILKRCHKYRYVLVTESVAPPARFSAPNVDIVHGPHTRSDVGSGLALDASPFDEPVSGVLVESPGMKGTILRTVIIDNAARSLP